MLECALTIMDQDLWSWQSNRKTWSWFESHIGAFLCVGKRIDVLGDIMTIVKAGYDGERRYVVTNLSLKLYDSDELKVEWVTDVWSYLDECMYHIIPLRLKICHCLSGDKHLSGMLLDTAYAGEITQCMSSQSVRCEHVWSVETRVTAMVSDTKAFFVGTKRGILYEYDNMACVGNTKRTFESHSSPIRQLHIMGVRLVSMCEEQVNVWDLRSGIKSMSLETKNKYVAVLPLKSHTICLIDEFNDRHSFVVWSLLTETPIRRIDMPESAHSTLLSIHQPEPSLLISNILYVLDTDIKTRVEVPGDVSCIVGNDAGIFGGTFCMVACRHELHFMSVVPDRVTLVIHALNTVMAWSNAWKTRLLRDAKQFIEPAIIESLNKGRATNAALDLLQVCTEEYEHRALWCSSHLVDALLQCSAADAANSIIRRLASFRGPRFDCAICADDERHGSICYLKTCHHRFHTGCITELIRKTPEYNDEMQYDYALTYSLKCPICRASFYSEDVGEDTLLNKYLYIPYTCLKG